PDAVCTVCNIPLIDRYVRLPLIWLYLHRHEIGVSAEEVHLHCKAQLSDLSVKCHRLRITAQIQYRLIRARPGEQDCRIRGDRELQETDKLLNRRRTLLLLIQR